MLGGIQSQVLLGTGQADVVNSNPTCGAGEWN